MEELYINHNTSKAASQSVHRISIEKRQGCKITGVIEICSFNENIVLLETVEGMLALKGNDFHVTRLDLDKGEADIDGRIDALQYSDKTSVAKRGESLLARLFGFDVTIGTNY